MGSLSCASLAITPVEYSPGGIVQDESDCSILSGRTVSFPSRQAIPMEKHVAEACLCEESPKNLR